MRRRQHCARGRPDIPYEGAVPRCNAKFVYAAVARSDHVRRQRVKHFVADYNCVERCGQRVQPRHAMHMLRHIAPQDFLLALSQVGAGFEDQITLRQAIERCQFRQHVAREFAAAGPELHDVGDAVAQNLRNLARERAAEQSTQFRRSDEVATGAELVCPGAVVAQCGRMQREFHVAREADPAVLRGDFGGDQFAQSPAVRQSGSGRRGKTQ